MIQGKNFSSSVSSIFLQERSEIFSFGALTSQLPVWHANSEMDWKAECVITLGLAGLTPFKLGNCGWALDHWITQVPWPLFIDLCFFTLCRLRKEWKPLSWQVKWEMVNLSSAKPPKPYLFLWSFKMAICFYSFLLKQRDLLWILEEMMWALGQGIKMCHSFRDYMRDW